jgi:hypothetical protein
MFDRIRLYCGASLFAPLLLGAALAGCGGAGSDAGRTGPVSTSALIGTAPVAPGNLNRSAVYGGGPFYSGGQAVMDDLRASGFNTVMLWSIHVEASTGNLFLNDKLVASNGSYVGDSGWPARLATLKQAPTGVTRIEVSIGSGGTNDFAAIRDLIAAQGTGATSILYRNFQALKAATGADAANFDDESTYDLNSSTQFGNMLSGLGYKITFAPYTQQSYWRSLKDALAGKVDTIYLQMYDGGALNDAGSWSNAMGMIVNPGLWSLHGSGCLQGDAPATVQARMSTWRTTVGITGGFMWLYDDMQACSAKASTAQYAQAINTAVGP